MPERATLEVDLPTELAAFIVALCWLGFGAILIVGKKGAAKATRTQDFKSHAGFLLQILGYAICFRYSRSYSPHCADVPTAESLISLSRR